MHLSSASAIVQEMGSDFFIHVRSPLNNAINSLPEIRKNKCQTGKSMRFGANGVLKMGGFYIMITLTMPSPSCNDQRCYISDTGESL